VVALRSLIGLRDFQASMAQQGEVAQQAALVAQQALEAGLKTEQQRS
jgi:hypothetical protein